MNKFKLTLENVIQGEKFCEIANFVYSPNINVGFDDYNKKNNTFDLKKLKEIIWIILNKSSSYLKNKGKQL
jgi:hypothetical protein